ncbi:MAG: lasso peptide biosynthesis B2 protein [Legionellales bacterium]|nr:lasso peptide biosynthesis B2 protein [Legionellales bacterium]
MMCWKMPLKYKAFLVINFTLCGIARAAIRTLPLSRLRPYFGQFQKTSILSTIASAKQHSQARLIGRSVRLAAKYTPWNSSCLTQAMVAKFWCRLYKIPYVFYIGFVKSTEEASGYKAHAWIMVGPVAVTGGDALNDYHVVSSYVYLRDTIGNEHPFKQHHVPKIKTTSR